MIINSANLNAIRVGFAATFKKGLGQAPSQYKKIATIVPSSAKENKYGWLGKLPNMRKWIGERVIHGLAEHDYAIKNEPFELTVGVDRDDIKDDNLGVYTPMFEHLGESVGAHPDQLVFTALKEGHLNECFDGQYFFDTDHPVIDEDGNEVTVSNDMGGAGTTWYLLCTARPIKPIIYQEREAAKFVAMDNPTDSNVFMKKEFVYGTEARRNVGYGLWVMAIRSSQTLDAAGYAAARQAMREFKGDHGRPLGLVPNLLVVPPALEGKANKLMKNEQIDGSDNEWKGTA
ncbi:Mu-like prophage major head subunit gpT family protein, partial [Actibacterium sp.]|uniref:Mu-like prophage major head subunit gpT family protein n=1 Tax=Actibacterium sp. TaxID=1872125 RepID=UPI00356AA07C